MLVQILKYFTLSWRCGHENKASWIRPLIWDNSSLEEDFAGEYVKSYLGTHFCFVVKPDTRQLDINLQWEACCDKMTCFHAVTAKIQASMTVHTICSRSFIVNFIIECWRVSWPDHCSYVVTFGLLSSDTLMCQSLLTCTPRLRSGSLIRIRAFCIHHYIMRHHFSR